MIAILYLPTLVLVQPAVAPSYTFGYNNRAGVLLVLMFVGIGAIWTKGLDFPLKTRADSKSISLRTLASALITVCFGCVVMYAFAGRFGGFGESGYGIDRVLQASQGKLPYLNFQFAYGPYFLYGPLLVRRLIPISLVQAYYLFWTLNCLLGIVILYEVINMIDYQSSSKRSIFLLLCGTGYYGIFTMGTNYTFVRFASPLFFILVVYKLFNRGGGKWRVYAAMLGLVFTVVLLLISPEIAIAHAFGCICIFLLYARDRRGGALTLCFGLLLSFAIVFCAALKLHLLDTVMEFGGGGYNSPIPLAPYMLLFLVALFVCACYVFKRFSEHAINDNTIALIAVSMPMVAAALGRCDSLHVVENGEGIFIASLIYVSNHPIAWKWSKVFFALFLIIVPAIAATRAWLPEIAKVGFNTLCESNDNSIMGSSLAFLGHKYITSFASPSKRAKWERTLENAQRIGPPETIDLSTIYPSWHRMFLAPFGYSPNGLGTYASGRIDFGFYYELANATSVSAIHRKLSELEGHPDKALLLSGYFQDSCKVDFQAERFEHSVEIGLPYTLRVVHPDSVSSPLCDYILAQYKVEIAPSPQNFGYGLWVNKNAEASP